MRHVDPDMCIRSVQEIRKLGRDPGIIASKIGCSRQLVNYWLSGDGIPGAYYLRKLHELGCDILYIITGGETDVRFKPN